MPLGVAVSGAGSAGAASSDESLCPIVVSTPNAAAPHHSSTPTHATPSRKLPMNASSPSRGGAEHTVHSAVSSTQVGDVSKKGGGTTLAVRASHHPTNHSHSSKLDMSLHLDAGASGAARAEILSKVLACANCEDVQVPLAVWCSACHKPGDPAPPVYCAACDADLHQFARTRHHARDSLAAVHTTRMRTAAELGLAGMPAGLPPLETLACSNCDGDAQVFCAQCKTILCTSCARDLHFPRLLRSHARSVLTAKFIVSGFKPHEEDQRAGDVTPLSALNGPSASSAVAPSSNSASPQVSSRTDALVKALKGLDRVKSKERGEGDDSSVVTISLENPGTPGDVFLFGDPSLTDPIGEAQAEFRNTVNAFDRLGGGLQIVSLSCGADHAGAVTSRGSLFMWGSNTEGQLGIGTRLGSERHSREPMLVEMPRRMPVRAVACGSVHTLALGQDARSVFAWGDGKMGKLGLVSDEDRWEPVLVPLGHRGPLGVADEVDMSAGEEVVSVACGQNNSGVIVRGRRDRHQLYIWGEGASGQIPAPIGTPADGSALEPRLRPQLVAIHTPENEADPFPEVRALAFGTKHVVAVTSANGSVFTWGDNAFYQCGYSLPANEESGRALQLTPRLVPKLFLDGVRGVSVACGDRHTSLLSSVGDIWSWGSGESHQIGIVDNVDQRLPQRALNLGPSANRPVRSLDVGASISAAVTESGETFLWGYGVESPTPTLVQGLRGKVASFVGVGANDNLALLTGASADLYEWQFDGQPLDAEETHGNAAGEAAAAAAAGLATIRSRTGVVADSSEAHSAASGGGKGVPAINAALRGKKVVAMSSGKNHYVVVTADGKMLAWGSNYLQECGLRLPGDVSYVPRPLEIKLKTPIVDVKCAVEHSIALSAAGHVYTWGTGFEGRLGHISNADVPEPRVIQTLVDSNVVIASTAIGPNNCGAVSADGRVYMWGAGNGGQIGNEDLLPQFKPILLKALLEERVTRLALGNYHACAITESGLVYTWGDNKFHQLGLNFAEDYAAYPQPVTALNALRLAPTQVECGDNVCLVLTAGGEVYGWGTGETMQLCRKDAPPAGSPPAAHEEEDFTLHEDVSLPVKLKFPFQTKESMRRITALSVRDINCCCVTEDASVYVWGWDLGEFPTQLMVRKTPASGNTAATSPTPTSPASNNSTSTATAKPAELVRWDKVTLGHTRMLLMTP